MERARRTRKLKAGRCFCNEEKGRLKKYSEAVNVRPFSPNTSQRELEADGFGAPAKQGSVRQGGRWFLEVSLGQLTDSSVLQKLTLSVFKSGISV